MTVKEAAKIIGTSEHSVRMGIKMGVLPIGYAYTTGHRMTFVILPDRLQAYVDGKDL